MNPGAGDVATYNFRANSVFDPDVEVGGNQPPGFDQWGVFFNKYTVVSSRAKLEVLPTISGITDNDAQLMILLQSRHTANNPDYDEFMGARCHAQTTSRIISGQVGGKGGMATLHQNHQLRRDFGHGRNNSTESGMAGNPQEQWYFNATCCNPWGNLIDAANVHCTMTITYTVLFHERRADIYDT